MLNGTAAWTFNRHQPKSCIPSLFALIEPMTVGRSHLQAKPLVLLLLFCLLTHKQTPGYWPTVRQCLFTLKTRVHTSELRHMDPRAPGKRKPGPRGSRRCIGRSSWSRRIYDKNSNCAGTMGKDRGVEEERSSVSSLSSMNPSCQESKVTAYMDTTDRAVN